MVSTVWAFVCYLAVAIVVTYPLVLSFDKSVSDPVDAMLNTWIMAYEHHALLTQPLELLNTNIFYPHKQTLLFSETLILPSLLLLPVRLVTGNALLTHNILVLLGFTLTGTSGYLLGRWLFHDHWPAMVVGGVLAFNSFTLSNIGQAQLLHLEWLPLALLYLVKLLQRPRIRFALLLALFLAAQFYTVIYYGIFGFLTVGFVGSVGWLGRAYPSPRERLRTACLIGMGLAIGVALCLPLALSYYVVSASYDFERLLVDTWPYSASLESWTTAHAGNLVYGQWLGNALPTLGFYPLDALFPGVILVCLAAIGLALGLWRALGAMRGVNTVARGRFLLWPLFLLLGIAWFFLLSFGPHPQIKSLQPNFEVTLPYAWIHDWVPGFHALRAPVRFAALVFLGLAVAAAYSLRFMRHRVVQLGACLLLLLEVQIMPTFANYTPQTSDDQQAAYAWLASLPPTVYLELPLYRFGEEEQEARWLESQFQSIKHWQATPVGYSGFFPPRYDELLDFLGGFPRMEVVALLQAMAVEWVVLHRDRMTEQEWQRIDQAIHENGWHVEKWGEVWAVRLVPRDVEQPAQHFVIPDVAQAGGMLTISSVMLSAAPVPLVPGGDLGRVHVEWWLEGQQVLSAYRVMQPPYFVDEVAISSFKIPVPPRTEAHAVKILGGDSRHEVTSQVVTLIEDVAPPETTVLPVRALEAELVCAEGVNRVDVLMQTIGWYDEPFTLSGRLIDGNGNEVARSAADVAFPPSASRKSLLQQERYSIPFDELPQVDHGTIRLELLAYTWQQVGERIVTRGFVEADGTVTNSIHLPLQHSTGCDV